MRVLFVPSYTTINPHQQLLADALRERDIDVAFAKGSGRLPLLGAVRTYGRPDVLHLHWTDSMLLDRHSTRRSITRSVLFVAQVALLRMIGVRIVWTVHNLNNHEHRHDAIENVANWILVRLYHCIIVYGETARQAVTEKFGLSRSRRAKFVNTGMGSYVGFYPNVMGRHDARSALGLRADHRVFLHFGIMRPYKGIDDLVAAFEHVPDSSVKLLIVGPPAKDAGGDEIVEMVEQARQRDPRIRLVPRMVADEEIQLYMNACDVVVLPFKSVLNSSSAILAMSYGKAIIAPRMGCLSELLNDRGTFLYAPDDTSGLQMALAAALQANTVAMGAHNAELAHRLDWHEVASRTLVAYIGLPSRRGSRARASTEAVPMSGYAKSTGAPFDDQVV